jgi:hypothetical protein
VDISAIADTELLATSVKTMTDTYCFFDDFPVIKTVTKATISIVPKDPPASS